MEAPDGPRSVQPERETGKERQRQREIERQTDRGAHTDTQRKNDFVIRNTNRRTFAKSFASCRQF